MAGRYRSVHAQCVMRKLRVAYLGTGRAVRRRRGVAACRRRRGRRRTLHRRTDSPAPPRHRPSLGYSEHLHIPDAHIYVDKSASILLGPQHQRCPLVAALGRRRQISIEPKLRQSSCTSLWLVRRVNAALGFTPHTLPVAS